MDTLVDGVSYLVTNADSDSGGFYHGDTRHLTGISVSLDEQFLPLFDESYRLPSAQTRRYGRMGTTVNKINDEARANASHVVLTRRERIVEGCLRETVHLTSYAGAAVAPTVVVSFDADFADIFEVRGHCASRERTVSVDVAKQSVTYGYEYEDADGERRHLETTVSFDREPATLQPGRATFEPSVSAQETWTVSVTVEPGGDESTVRAQTPAAADSERTGSAANAAGVDDETGTVVTNGSVQPPDGRRTETTRRVDPFAVTDPISIGDRRIDAVLAQSHRDVVALTTCTEWGCVPLAGAPWFVTMFGRDSALAAYLLVPFAPELARGTIRYLAAHQGTERDDETDERPGKLFHEIRHGELARTKVIPHTPYFGAVDTTPLWIVLLSEYWRWSGDDEFVRKVYSNLSAALEWIDRETAAGGDDPFLYYQDLGRVGVAHREWRDSASGVQFADGTNATPPIASAAVQGYVYDSLQRASELAATVGGDDEVAATLSERATELAAAFDEAFWMPDRSFYATGLTVDGRQVDSVTSGVGQCLWSGIVPSNRMDRVADRLLDPGLFSGWGIRTLDAGETGYDPLSYHAGSVWPHDNALAALGLAKAGYYDRATRVSMAQFEAFTSFESNSVPELFCGFDDSSAPVPYAAACQPQAWAAATPYGFVRALLALDPDQPCEPVVAEPVSGLTVDAVAPFLDRWQ